MSNNLLPISDPKKFINKDGEIITPLYRKGDPRNYRLNMGNGVLTLEGREQVTVPTKPFSVLPIAFRCLEDGLFGSEVKKWCEVYFINEAGALCVFMFHGYSVENLSRKSRDLFYSQAGLTEVVWNISFVEKINKAAKSKYYIAEFDFELVDIEDLPTIKAVKKNIVEKYHHIYRSETADSKTLFQENWSDGKVLTAEEIKEKEENQKALAAEFEPPVKKKHVKKAA